MEIRHGATVENGVTYVYAKCGNDWLWNEKALADRKSDNNTSNNKNNVCGALRPVSWSKKHYVQKNLSSPTKTPMKRSPKYSSVYVYFIQEMQQMSWVVLYRLSLWLSSNELIIRQAGRRLDLSA